MMELKSIQPQRQSTNTHGTFIALAIPKKSSWNYPTWALRGGILLSCVCIIALVFRHSPQLDNRDIAQLAYANTQPCEDAASPLCLFDASTAQSWFAPPRNIHPSVSRDRPIPTNRWWGNLISAAREDTVPEKRVWTNPYAILLQSTGIVVSFPFSGRYFDGNSGNGGSKSYSHAYTKDMTLGAVDTSNQPFLVTGWDDLGVTLRQDRANNHWIETTLVSGMAYATATYSNVRPKISASYKITAINSRAIHRNTGRPETFRGMRFVLALSNGLSWVLYASSPLTFTAVDDKSFQSTEAFNGDIRVALVRTPEDIAAHDKYNGCIVKGGNLTYVRFTYSFNWATTGSCSSGLLHFALQHHADTLDATNAIPIDSMSHLESATRGRMIPVVTLKNPHQWSFKEDLIPVEVYPRQRPTSDRIQQTKLLDHLTADIDATWDMPADGSYYFNGKKAQKYASLCLMASDRAVVRSDDALLARCQQKLEQILARFMSNTFQHRLVYDTVYKGIVTTQGFDESNTYADFGNTIYNDHHYHFGYWVVTAAIANIVHPNMPNLALLNQRISFLIRDVANTDKSDNAFPSFRMFDWFKGHSYSHGITVAIDGKDLESTSEDINFYYGMALFGQATGQVALENLGRLMLTVNARSVQTYFLMDSSNLVHPESIRVNHVPGIYFDNKVTYTTWFSNERKSIHMIQMLPVTPVTEFVRTKKFIQEEWDDILSKLPIIQNDIWNDAAISLLYLNYAAVNPTVALQKLQYVALDDGLSRSWALYMAACRY